MSGLDLVLFGPPGPSSGCSSPFGAPQDAGCSPTSPSPVAHSRDTLRPPVAGSRCNQGRSGAALSELRQTFGAGILETPKAASRWPRRPPVDVRSSRPSGPVSPCHGEACRRPLTAWWLSAGRRLLAGTSLRDTEEFDAWQTFDRGAAAVRVRARAISDRPRDAAAACGRTAMRGAGGAGPPAQSPPAAGAVYAATGDRAAAAV